MLRRSATILIFLLACSLGLSAGSAAHAGEQVEPSALAERLARGDAPQLLDVRTAEEFAAGHLPGAVLIPHDVLASRLDELDRDRPVVVYCRTGRRAALAEELLRRRGFEVAQLQGSWEAWQAAGLPQEPERTQTPVPTEAQR